MPKQLENDPDVDALLEYIAPSKVDLHGSQIARLSADIVDYVRTWRARSDAPDTTPDVRAITVGLFGQWGSGKTMFLAQLAQELMHQGVDPSLRVIYFDAWKYSDATDLVPAFVYKLLRHGFATEDGHSELIGRVLFALGSKYADSLGEWAKHFVGVDPTKVFKDLRDLKSRVEKSADPTAQIAEEYYCRVDRVRDQLREAAKKSGSIVVALIDEIDRCDPDEAFAMFKELRVFFSMRKMPLFLVIAANPDPIGLAIKHKYGLENSGSDYEARRILEKFVDRYFDLSETILLKEFVRSNLSILNCNPGHVSFAAAVDEYIFEDVSENTVFNSSQFDAITSRNPLYGNLRVLQKSMHVAFADREWSWTFWHLDLASQLDSRFRQDIATTAPHIATAAESAYRTLRDQVRVIRKNGKDPAFTLDRCPERTVFAFLRSRIWEGLRNVLHEIQKVDTPDARHAGQVVARFLEDRHKMDFIANMSMIGFEVEEEIRDWGGGSFEPWLNDDVLNNRVVGEFGWELANH